MAGRGLRATRDACGGLRPENFPLNPARWRSRGNFPLAVLHSDPCPRPKSPLPEGQKHWRNCQFELGDTVGQYFIPVFIEEDTTAITAWFYSHDFGSGLKLMEHCWLGNEFVTVVESRLKTPKRVVWAGDEADREPDGPNLYFRAPTNPATRLVPENMVGPIEGGRYVINHDRRTYVDKAKIKKDRYRDGWVMHPLPILTAEGEGNEGLWGSWARARITVADEIPEEYTELEFDPTEF
ncbi:hypothetical protein AB0C65_36000 [Nocardia sp. NPDC048505]|uniref:hypothetical protein n=1 Tax=Nocardia sp. NPDC048505 TaxID=3155756 RepID=UPI0033D3CCB7